MTTEPDAASDRQRPRRSCLAVPGSSPRFLEKAQSLRSQGVAAVFTPRDFGITAIIGRIVDEIRLAHKLQPWPGRPASLAGVTQPASTTTMEG